ncbi:unnamed protein product [Calypogeia fissa]
MDRNCTSSAMLIALPPELGASNPGQVQALTKALEALPPKMASAGIKFEFAAVKPEERALAELGRKLQSKRPDVVVIGNGIRSAMELTYFMEQIIDIVRTNAPQAKLAFNVNPVDTLDAVKRWLPTAAAPAPAPGGAAPAPAAAAGGPGAAPPAPAPFAAAKSR